MAIIYKNNNKMKKSYLLVVLFLSGLSAGTVFAAAPTTPKQTWASWTRSLLPRAKSAATAAVLEDDLGLKLIDATLQCDKAKVEELIAYGADVNAAGLLGNTALTYAAIRGNTDIAKLLLDAKADVNATDRYGNTALMKAAARDFADIIKLLLNREANMNAVAQNGRTALMLAAYKGHENIVDLLLSNGADKTILNLNHKTAEDIARDGKRYSLANYIKDYDLPPGRLTKSALKK